MPAALPGPHQPRRAALLIAALAAILAGLPFILKSRMVLPPPPPPGALLWSADHETGDPSQWGIGQFGEAVFNDGTGRVSVSSAVAHSGRFSLRMDISDAHGETQAVRLLRWQGTPDEGYYSAWFYFPERYEPAVWWNVFQFKSGAEESDPTWVLNVGNRAGGQMYLYLWDAITGTSYRPLATRDVPVRRWTQVTAYYRRAVDRSGRITVWQDGVRLFDIDRVQTAFSGHIVWGVGNYTDDINPPAATIYVDDAAIRAVGPAPAATR